MSKHDQNRLNHLSSSSLHDIHDVSCLWERLGVIYESIESPWIPTPKRAVEIIMDIANIGRGDVFYDLGCGDGRLVIEAAERGADAVCIEIDPKLIEVARRNALSLGLADIIKFVNKDMVDVNLSPASVVYMYLTTNAIDRIKNKLVNELKPGALLISLDYGVDFMEPIEVIDIDVDGRRYKVLLYLLPDNT